MDEEFISRWACAREDSHLNGFHFAKVSLLVGKRVHTKPIFGGTCRDRVGFY